MLSKKALAVLLSLAASVSLYANDPFSSDPFGDDIFKEMMQMQQQMDRMFEQMHKRIQQRSAALISPLGSYKIAQKSQFVDKGDHYELVTDIPKSKDNNIKISLQNHILNIDAKIIKKSESKSNGISSYQSYMSVYQRSISLPQDADESSMKSDYKNGYLVITFAKKKGAQSISVSPSKDNNKTDKKPVNSAKSSMG